MKIGIDLGGTKTEGILIDNKGKEISRNRIKTEKNYDGTIHGIISIVKKFETELTLPSADFQKIIRDMTNIGDRIEIRTENDSEVAAGYLMCRMQQGDTLQEALEAALEDLDGFYTFAIGTADGFAVLRDPIACKPAVLAETDDYVAMASEFQALADLPGIDEADVWEPKPAQVYTWGAAN